MSVSARVARIYSGFEAKKTRASGAPLACHLASPGAILQAETRELQAVMSAISLEQARKAKQQASALFSQFATVVGVGITKLEDGYGIKVNLQQEPNPSVVLPESVEGVPVKVEVVGRISKVSPSVF
jgi:hypothetical protein